VTVTHLAYTLEAKHRNFAYVLEEKHWNFAYVLEEWIIFVVEFQRFQYDTTQSISKPPSMGGKKEPETPGDKRSQASWQDHTRKRIFKRIRWIRHAQP
jgi:hypothetical protein